MRRSSRPLDTKFAQRASSLALACLGTLALMASIRVTGMVLTNPLAWVIGDGDRAVALVLISVSVIGQAAFISALFVASRRTSLPILAPNVFAAGKPLGWIIAIILVVFWVYGLTMDGAPLASQPIREVSVFNLAGSLLAGLGAGSLEEIFFRGVIITLLARNGFPVWSQVVASAILFGFAHVGWGLLTGTADVGAAVGAIVATTILGLTLGIIFVTAGRSLTPAIAAHVLINLLIEPWFVLAALAST